MTSSTAPDDHLDAGASTPPLDAVDLPKPKYDNFYTPQNQDFYNQIEYVNLDRKERRIRLLRIHPIQADEDDSATIRCDVVDNLSLASMDGKFTNLSYCAGDPKKTESILVNGIRFNAFANLGHALRQVRHYWNKNCNDRELLLWADQVCIDQSNSNERSHQVNFMGDIYAAGEQVLVCLSVEGSPTGGFEWLKSALETMIRLKGSAEIFQPQQFLELNWSNEHLHRNWDAFIQTCLNSPWFKRAWVRQEFIRSRGATFLAAFEAASYTDFRQCSTMWYRTTQLSPKVSLDLLGKCSASASNCSLCRWADDPTNPSDVWFTVARFLIQKHSTSDDLVHNLYQAYLCQSSDQRDLVYAFLGFSAKRYNIIPNYDPSVSYASLCTQVARNYLLQTADLDILAEACTRALNESSRDSSISSWVPDWRVQPFIRMYLHPRGRKILRVSRTEFTFQPCGDGHAQQILAVRGLLLLSLDRRAYHESFSLGIIDYGTEYWTKMGIVKAWGRCHEGDEVWILPGASQAFTFRRKEQYHELRGGVTFLRPLDRSTESIEDAIKTPATDDWIFEYHDSQMAILIEKVNRLIEENDPSIQTINIC